MSENVGKAIGKAIKLAINIILFPVLAIVWVFSVFTDGLVSNSEKKRERNAENGSDIRSLCQEMGVSGSDYNKIVVNQMDKAKDIAMKIGQRGEPHEKTPWNTRLALAIVALHEHEVNKKSDATGQSTQKVDDLLNALENYISEYEITHGEKPKTIMIDHQIHMSFAHAGVYRDRRFGDIDLVPTAGIEGGLVWKAV